MVYFVTHASHPLSLNHATLRQSIINLAFSPSSLRCSYPASRFAAFRSRPQCATRQITANFFSEIPYFHRIAASPPNARKEHSLRQHDASVRTSDFGRQTFAKVVTAVSERSNAAPQTCFPTTRTSSACANFSTAGRNKSEISRRNLWNDLTEYCGDASH